MEARRSSRARAPVDVFVPTVVEVTPKKAGKKRPAAAKKSKASKKAKTSAATIRKNPKRKSAPQYLEDEEGNQVWLAPVTVQDVLRAQKTKRHPFANGKRRLYLHTVTSPAQRQAVYERARRALVDIEQCLLPTYGGRPWKVQVTITDPVVQTKSQKKAHPVSPYFIFQKKGLLELATWPQVLAKIPAPPKFPGYYADSRTKETAKAAAKKKKKMVKQEETSEDVGEVPSAGEEVIDNDEAAPEEVVEEEEEEDSDDDEEEEVVDEEMELIYDLQERDVTPLSELAFKERWRAPMPNITIKWISPLREIFNSRKSAWEHAVALCKQDVLLEKVVRGYDLMRNRPLPLSTVVPAKRALHVGELRFKRDGLWVVGQEELWKEHREDEVEIEQTATVAAAGTTTTRRPLSGQQHFLQSNRRELQAKRQKELNALHAERAEMLDASNNHGVMGESPTSAGSIEAANMQSDSSNATKEKPKKFTLKDADDALRQQWKELSPEEKETWKQKAAEKEAQDTAGAVTLTPAKKSPLGGEFVLEVSDGESTPLPGTKRRLNVPTATGRVTPPSSEDSSADGSPSRVASSSSTPLSAVSSPPVTAVASSTAIVSTKKLAPSNTKPAPWQKWCLNADQVKLCYDAGMDHYDSVIATVKARALHRELEDGFDVLRERGRGRFDMELPAFDEPAFNFLTDLKRAPWMPVVRTILGKDVVLIHKGMFLSMPGADHQQYHQDGVHLSTQTQRDCHAINVFVPLIDLTLKHGPTEFCLGTHILDQEEYNYKYIETPVVSAGTPIIFDYRLGHKGLSNTSGSCRPVLYCTYACENNGKEFRDSVNFSRKRYHRIGDLVSSANILSRKDRAEKRQRALESLQLEEEEAEIKRAKEESMPKENL